MFEAEQLPTCVVDLDALLTQVNANDLAHRSDETVPTFSAPSKRRVAVNEEMICASKRFKTRSTISLPMV